MNVFIINAVDSTPPGERRRVVIAGGAGQLGQILIRAFERRGDEVVVLSRGRHAGGHVVAWDGRTSGPWASELDGADAVINLAGRSVNCRYTKTNLTQMLASRVDSTHAVGLAIAQVLHPPRVWLQMSTATIYAHRFDAPNDEQTGCIGGHELDAPAYWRMSVEIASAWEQALADAHAPDTRKVAMRTAMVMGPEPDGVFEMLSRLMRCGLGGPLSGGRQFVSWIHETDFVRAVEFLLERDELDGAINVAAPAPLPQREFMAALRAAGQMTVGLPATSWMAELGAFVLRTDTELLLKSRRVIPRRLLDAGFTFEFPEWPAAAHDLLARQKKAGR